MSNFYSTPKSLFREDWLSFDSSQQLDILLTIKKMSDCSKANSQSLNLTHSQSKYSVFCIASKVHSKEFLASFPFQFCGRCWEKVPGYESKTKQYLSTAWNQVPASLCGQKSRHVPSFFLVLNIRKLLQIFFFASSSEYFSLLRHFKGSWNTSPKVENSTEREELKSYVLEA